MKAYIIESGARQAAADFIVACFAPPKTNQTNHAREAALEVLRRLSVDELYALADEIRGRSDGGR